MTVPAYADALSYGHREAWLPGEAAWFEYHCNESLDSPDAPAWLHSHQVVTVLSENLDDNPRPWAPTIDDRGEAGHPVTYQVRFADGIEWTVFEDELLVTPDHFGRPDPPRSAA